MVSILVRNRGVCLRMFPGDIMYIRLLDADVIVVNSTDVATNLLEKRSHIYSDRPFVAAAAAP